MKSWSLRVERAGADPSVIDEIVGSLSNEIYDGILTFELYRIVFSKLRNQRTGVAGRYNLKQAIMQLGPTGFPFERLIAALFESDGFRTKVGEIVRGKCVSHEVDVMAENAELHHLAECKFHSFRGKVCDVKHALYMHARFVDLEKRFLAEPAHSYKTHKGWLITNTRMTSDAIEYGTCVGLGLLSWDFPAERSLRAWIDSAGLHPVTCLTSLSVKQKQQLLKKGVVLCRELTANPRVLDDLGIPGAKIDAVMAEVNITCKR